jgi:hypothetical protein
VIRARFEIYQGLPIRKVETMRPATAIVDEGMNLPTAKAELKTKTRQKKTSYTRRSGGVIRRPQLEGKSRTPTAGP